MSVSGHVHDKEPGQQFEQLPTDDHDQRKHTPWTQPGQAHCIIFNRHVGKDQVQVDERTLCSK
jgi:hypothetical protein